MTEMQNAWLVLATLSGLGLIMIFTGIMIRYFTEKRNKSCSEKTIGKVVKYSFPGDGRMYPVVEFFANGSCYKTRKKFNGIKSFHVSGIPIPVKADAWEDEKGWLHVKTGPIADLAQLAEKLWPMGSEMDVYYNPENPKKNYVDRPLNNNFICFLFVIIGLFTAAIGVLVFFLMQM